jgi:hypothetical protein
MTAFEIQRQRKYCVAFAYHYLGVRRSAVLVTVTSAFYPQSSLAPAHTLTGVENDAVTSRSQSLNRLARLPAKSKSLSSSNVQARCRGEIAWLLTPRPIDPPRIERTDHGAALITVSGRTGFYSIIRIFIVLLLRIVAIFICLCWMQAITQDHRAERLKKAQHCCCRRLPRPLT